MLPPTPVEGKKLNNGVSTALSITDVLIDFWLEHQSVVRLKQRASYGSGIQHPLERNSYPHWFMHRWTVTPVHAWKSPSSRAQSTWTHTLKDHGFLKNVPRRQKVCTFLNHVDAILTQGGDVSVKCAMFCAKSVVKEYGPLQYNLTVWGTTFFSTSWKRSMFDTSWSNCFECNTRLVLVTVISMELYSTVGRFLIVIID